MNLQLFTFFRNTLLFLFLSFCLPLEAQYILDWDEDYELTISDFQAQSTQIGDREIYRLRSTSRMEFSFHMSNLEFMATKNFNSKVSCRFTRDAAVLIAPDQESAQALLDFANYEFDLAELYARKFRKQLYEKKGAFSSASFFQPIFQDLDNEMADRHSIAAEESDLGRDSEKLNRLHADVLEEITMLADFCKECKPGKGKKTDQGKVQEKGQNEAEGQ